MTGLTMSLETAELIKKTGFLGFIVASRAGLYGFGIGEVQLCQIGIVEKARGEVNSVETSLTSVATLIVEAASMIMATPQHFVYLMWGSIICVNIGSLIFIIWNMRWALHSGDHSHLLSENESDHTHDHALFHTKLQNDLLAVNGYRHSHPHFHYRYQANHAHDHSHIVAVSSDENSESNKAAQDQEESL